MTSGYSSIRDFELSAIEDYSRGWAFFVQHQNTRLPEVMAATADFRAGFNAARSACSDHALPSTRYRGGSPNDPDAEINQYPDESQFMG